MLNLVEIRYVILFHEVVKLSVAAAYIVPVLQLLLKMGRRKGRIRARWSNLLRATEVLIELALEYDGLTKFYIYLDL